jgi:ATP-dependent helicase/nuclease subunit A
VIDLLFEEEDGWVIVEFKTDTFDEADLTAFVDYYRPQVELYCNEWENTFHYKVKEKGLYFTEYNQYVVV